MSATVPAQSPRRAELLELAYEYVLEHGVADLSLRPLAAAVNSSPRVLLFLFGSKAELVQAILARARADELALLDRVRAGGAGGDLIAVASEVWSWLAAEEHRGVLTLWVEGYARSLIDPDGPWSGFAAATVADWLGVLSASGAGDGEATLVLAILRGAFLDLLATGDLARTNDAVNRQLALMSGGGMSPPASPGSPASPAVRRGIAADATAIGRLLHDFNTEYDDPTPGPDKLAARIEQLIAGGDTAVLLAGPGPDGLAVLRFRPAIWSEALECYLAELYVAPAARGRGLGRALMDAAIELARAEGADYMDLGTGETDVAARALYESLGFSNREGKPGGPVNYFYERDL